MKKIGRKNTKNFTLDISHDVCPITFVKVKILLDKMSLGSVAKILLIKGDALENVPKSIKEEGHDILRKTKQTGDNYLLLIRKNK